MIGYMKLLEVKSPNRGTNKSAGIDLFIPENTADFFNVFRKYNQNTLYSTEGILLAPFKDVLIPSGLKFKIPSDTMLMVANKSSVSTKKKLIHGAHIIDEDYTGQILIHLINTHNKHVFLSFGEKITQVILVPILYPSLIEYPTTDELYRDHTSMRGEGGFGSTGTI